MARSVRLYIVLAAFILADQLLKKKLPVIWRKLQLPLLVVLTLLSMIA